MSKPTSIILEPDADDFCYLFAQAITRLLEEEDAATHSKQKHLNRSGDLSITTLPISEADSEEMPIDH